MSNHSRFSKSSTTRLNGATRSLTSFINPEPYMEIGLKQDAPLLQSYNTSQQSLACDFKGSDRWTDGSHPVDLYQVGSYGPCLSALRSRLLCPIEGVFNSKGAVKMGAVKSFQGGNHVNKKVPACAVTTADRKLPPPPDLAH